MEMPPLMRRVMERNAKAKAQVLSEDDLRLPAHKTYQGDHILEERTESNAMNQFLTPQYANFEGFDMSLIPESWKLERLNLEVGRQKWPGRHGHRGYEEGLGWEEYVERNEAEEAYRAQVAAEENTSGHPSS